jgi:hypothetical protein
MRGEPIAASRAPAEAEDPSCVAGYPRCLMSSLPPGDALRASLCGSYTRHSQHLWRHEGRDGVIHDNFVLSTRTARTGRGGRREGRMTQPSIQVVVAEGISPSDHGVVVRLQYLGGRGRSRRLHGEVILARNVASMRRMPKNSSQTNGSTSALASLACTLVHQLGFSK